MTSAEWIALADTMEQAATQMPGMWVNTATKIRQAASSIRWQVRWDEQHHD